MKKRNTDINKDNKSNERKYTIVNYYQYIFFHCSYYLYLYLYFFFSYIYIFSRSTYKYKYKKRKKENIYEKKKYIDK